MMGAIFRVPTSDINSDSSVDIVETWDSFNHLKLVLSLEEAYDIEFTEQEVTELLSFELVMLTLQTKGIY